MSTEWIASRKGDARTPAYPTRPDVRHLSRASAALASLLVAGHAHRAEHAGLVAAVVTGIGGIRGLLGIRVHTGHCGPYPHTWQDSGPFEICPGLSSPRDGSGSWSAKTQAGTGVSGDNSNILLRF